MQRTHVLHTRVPRTLKLQCTYAQGSPLQTRDLRRTLAQESQMIFILSDKDSFDPIRQDQMTIFRAMSIKRYVTGFHRDVKTLFQLNRPECKVNCYGSRMFCFRCRTPKPGAQMRPGDWACECRNVNFARRDTCFKCDRPRPAAGGFAPPPYAYAPPPVHMTHSPHFAHAPPGYGFQPPGFPPYAAHAAGAPPHMAQAVQCGALRKVQAGQADMVQVFKSTTFFGQDTADYIQYIIYIYSCKYSI